MREKPWEAKNNRGKKAGLTCPLTVQFHKMPCGLKTSFNFSQGWLISVTERTSLLWAQLKELAPAVRGVWRMCPPPLSVKGAADHPYYTEIGLWKYVPVVKCHKNHFLYPGSWNPQLNKSRDKRNLCAYGSIFSHHSTCSTEIIFTKTSVPARVFARALEAAHKSSLPTSATSSGKGWAGFHSKCKRAVRPRLPKEQMLSAQSQMM